jgi:membrane protease subunit HflC
MGTLKFIGVLIGVAAVLVYLSTFFVDERELAIKFRLGEIIASDFEPGLHFQVPFVNNVRKFDGRILTLDTPPRRFLTSEKKNVIVDSFIKWRIIDPAQFYRATQGDERIAISRLSQIISKFGDRTIQEVISGERALIMDRVREVVDKEVRNLGMTVVDVRLKRVDLPEEVSTSVYQRMVKERATVAKAFRSRGEEKAKGIRANADRQREEILAEAYREAQQVRGEGDGKAAQIYAQAYDQDAEFYSLYRSLIAYRRSFAGKSDVLIISPNTEFFKYFNESEVRAGDNP